MLKPKHTASSVAVHLEKGLRDGSIDLGETKPARELVRREGLHKASHELQRLAEKAKKDKLKPSDVAYAVELIEKVKTLGEPSCINILKDVSPVLRDISPRD